MTATASEVPFELAVHGLPKSDSSPREYEDAVAYQLHEGGVLRLAVADGATEAYDARRWVDLLTSDFVARRVVFDPMSFTDWVRHRQEQWSDLPPRQFSSYWDEARACNTPAYGTFIGVEADAVGWRAVSVGDAVLVHVSGGRRIATFPELTSAQFGLEPGLVTTRTDDLVSLAGQVRVSSGRFRHGDTLIVATDALAQWALATDEREAPPWNVLASIGPSGFERLVRASRASKELHDDDVTMAVVRPKTELRRDH